MIKLYVSDDNTDLGLLRGALESEGIACTVKNEAVRQIRPGPSSPYGPAELWILHDVDADRALAIANDWKTAAAEMPAWKCQQCGEDNEGQFGECWSCSAAAPAL